MTSREHERSRRFTILLTLILIAGSVPLILPGAVASPPEQINNLDPHTLDNPVTDLALDARGRIAAVGVSEPGTDNPLLPAPDLTILDLATQSAIQQSSHGRDGADHTAQYVAVARGNPGDASGSSKFAIAGPGAWIHVFARGNDAPIRECNEEAEDSSSSSPRVTDVAMTKDGRFVAVSYENVETDTDSTTTKLGRFVVYDTNTPQADWCGDAANRLNTNRRANVVAIARDPGPSRDDQVFAVGTDDRVKVYHGTQFGESLALTFPNNEPAQDLQFSDDGRFLVVGTGAVGDQAGTFYFLDVSGSGIKSWSRSFGSAVTSVTISADGRMMAAGLANGDVQFFRNIAKPGAHAADPGPTWDGPGSQRVRSLDASQDGRTIVGAAGNLVVGWHQDTGNEMWRTNLGGTVTQVAISHRGDRLVASVGDQVFAFQQFHSVTVSAEDTRKEARPNEEVSFSVTVENDGSLPDNFTVSIQYPSGWRQVTDDLKRTILPGETTDVRIRTRPPKLEPPGVYPTVVRVTSESQAGFLDTLYLNTTVLRTENINITSTQRDLRVNASVEEVYAFTVLNEGNDDAYLNFTVLQDPSTGVDWDIHVREYQEEPEVEPVRVERGEQRTLTLSVTAPSTAVDGDHNDVTVILDAGNDTEVLRFTARVNPDFSLQAVTDKQRLEFLPGQSKALELRITNTGNTIDTVNVSSLVLPDNVRRHWTVEIPDDVRKDNITLARGSHRTVVITVRPAVGEPSPATVRLLVNSTGGVRERVDIPVSIAADDGDDRVPGPALPMILASLLAAAAAAARRGRRGRALPGRPR